MITISARLAPDVLMRPVTPDDAAGLARAQRRSRDHLKPWDPARSESFYTTEGQRARLEVQRAEQEAERMLSWVLVRDGDEYGDEDDIVGGIVLSDIVRGQFRSADLGYWIDVGHVGRGLAGAAVRQVCESADSVLGLHRLQAGTLLDNVVSQRVLAKNGFEPYGVAERYLHIAGAWRDHRLFQRILNDRRP
ncbi:GNAT family N-acetyltransferase [Streptomyces pinistramenti]|uniref:GNAT family N-acetyltransferase n=1 Tax=Streptomyces pinistramenti TaxID=2884812 RepID=UPI001D097AD1|nr:GNAT family protein [Streptomyces pinistramenti]MCB5910712.1 GNAT family N-acetyltransferase [Streptomyces pinistramenti]